MQENLPTADATRGIQGPTAGRASRAALGSTRQFLVLLRAQTVRQESPLRPSELHPQIPVSLSHVQLGPLDPTAGRARNVVLGHISRLLVQQNAVVVLY